MKTIHTAFPLLGFWDTRQGGRSENQDSCGFIDTPYGMLAIVCDGMGGGPAGKQASVLAVQVIAEYIHKAPKGENISELLRNAVEQANRAIITRGEEKPDLRGMGSTVVAVLFNEEAAFVANVGDSRVYQFRHGSKVFRTEDHSVVADMVRSKALTEEQARLSEQSNIITRVLGRNTPNLVDVTVLPYEKKDRFLLCTDGIWGAMAEKVLVARVSKTPSLAGAVDSIVIHVDENGKKAGNKHDNLTLALFDTKKDSKKKTKMNRKAINIIGSLLVFCTLSLLLNLWLAAKLRRPNTDKQLLEKTEKLLIEKDNTITSLKWKVDSLQAEWVKSEQEAANAKIKVAEERQKVAEIAAEKMRQDAEKKRQEDVEKASQEIKQKRMEAIELLKEVQSIKSWTPLKKEKINETIIIINELIEKDYSHKKVYLDLREKLNPQTVKNNEQKGHIDIIIKQLETIE